MDHPTITLGMDEDGNEVVMTKRTPYGVVASEIQQASSALKDLFDSLTGAGFTDKQAIDLLCGIFLRRQS